MCFKCIINYDKNGFGQNNLNNVHTLMWLISLDCIIRLPVGMVNKATSDWWEID